MSDVRLVLYYGVPRSVMEVYQMFGRAGRDGKSSTCVLLYKSLSLRGKTVDSSVSTLITSKQCIRARFCRLLDSSYNADSQRDFPCCYHCDFDQDDPNKLFVYPKTRPRKRRIHRGQSDQQPQVKIQVSTYMRNLLARRLLSWRRREAEAHRMFSLGVEGVASNALLEKIIDVSSSIRTVSDAERIPGVQKRFAASLFQALHFPENSIEHDHC